MIKLTESLNAIGSPSFSEVFKNEAGSLDGDLLPLQQGISQGNYANVDDFKIVVLSVIEEPEVIRVKAGIFFTSVISGCACADDPTPEDKLTEYCEMQFSIDSETAETSVSIVS